MKKEIMYLIFTAGLSILSIIAVAQVSFNSCGGDISGTGGFVSYSCGQTFCSLHSGANTYIVEGVQQPYEISILSVVEDEITANLYIFPNPVADYLNLKIEDLSQPLTAILFDINGRIIQEFQITNSESLINMANMVASTYFLKLSNQGKEIKTFKINKY